MVAAPKCPLLSSFGIKHKGGAYTYTPNTHTHKIKFNKSKKNAIKKSNFKSGDKAQWQDTS